MSWRTGETATSPNPSATLHRETRTCHGQETLPKPPRLADTADNATRQNSGGCGKTERRARQTAQQKNLPGKPRQYWLSAMPAERPQRSSRQRTQTARGAGHP